MSLLESFAVLFPHLASLCVNSVLTRGSTVRIEAEVARDGAACPGCGHVSRRVHSRYDRRLLDLAVGGRETIIQLRVRRFVCQLPACGRKTFVEQIEQLTVPHAGIAVTPGGCWSGSAWRWEDGLVSVSANALRLAWGG